MITRISTLAILLSALLFQGGCAMMTSTEDKTAAGKLEGKIVYTQVNIHSLKGKIVSWINYQIDSLVPVNTAVTIDEISGAKVVFTIKETGQTLHLKNKTKHSGMSGLDWANKHLGPSPVKLDKFTKSDQEAITLAKAQKGMPKDAVLISLGYPPAHKTPSLDSPTWTYWINKWNKLAVEFGDNGKVKQVIN